jgi:mannose/fructose/N-acetylgalactosamine-specific phosphotransferase system component IID
MSKLTIDELNKAQQQTDANIDGIIKLLEQREESKIGSLASGLVSLIVFAFGAYLAFNGNLAGVCVCMIAISARIERLLSKKV